MCSAKLREFLDKNQIKYVLITHSTAYTAQEIAAVVHIKGKELAKSVIVKLDDVMAMAVLPAPLHIDLAQLRAATGAKAIALASEPEFKSKFPDCETGAMPPFGNLYGLAVYADESLTADKEIVFNAGSHNELIRLPYVDFERLAKPTMLKFAAGSGKHFPIEE